MNTRREKLLKFLVENGGNMQKAMIAAGYSEAYAKNSHKLKKTKWIKILANEAYPDSILLNAIVHKLNYSSTKESIHFLELAYKLKGRLQ